MEKLTRTWESSPLTDPVEAQDPDAKRIQDHGDTDVEDERIAQNSRILTRRTTIRRCPMSTGCASGSTDASASSPRTSRQPTSGTGPAGG